MSSLTYKPEFDIDRIEQPDQPSFTTTLMFIKVAF